MIIHDLRRWGKAQNLKTPPKKEKVEAHLGEKDYYCNCVAGNSKGVLAHSKNGYIRIAYFKTEFRLVFKMICSPAPSLIFHGVVIGWPIKRGVILKTILSEEPYDKNEEIGGSVELVCVPPDGLPTPKISWLKDGNLIPTDGTNTLINYNGNLIIRAARLQDSGKYRLFFGQLRFDFEFMLGFWNQADYNSYWNNSKLRKFCQKF